MKKITDIFDEKPWTLSFEFFPPKTDKGRQRLWESAEALAGLGADFFSVTYGAGGSESHATLDVVLGLLYRHDVAVMHHLTCIKHTYREIREQLAAMSRVGVRNIMALRGDPRKDEPDFVPGPDQPKYAYQLVEIIHELRGDWFCTGVAAFPEGHPMAGTVQLDSQYLRIKQDRGADFAVTQLFFNNDVYLRFVDRVRDAGVSMRLIPGLLPVVNYEKLVQFCNTCGATIPKEVHEIFEPIKNDPEETRKRGIDFAVRQCQDLINRGAPGLHLYCLNRAEPARTIVDAVDF
ncbi:MAG: methylenetetrahydrofolate reductase [NAD(P)H] [Phycisphaerae bacterium]|nr:methylenetetrahydrofolate reductase [NAD(P)H] [Phycisphaerae bacterium]